MNNRKLLFIVVIVLASVCFLLGCDNQNSEQIIDKGKNGSSAEDDLIEDGNGNYLDNNEPRPPAITDPELIKYRQLIVEGDTVLRDILVYHDFGSDWIGVVNYGNGQEYPIFAAGGEYTTVDSVYKEVENFYTKEVIYIELNRRGYFIVNEKLGFIPASGEQQYYVDDEWSTFEIIDRTDTQVTVAVGYLMEGNSYNYIQGNGSLDYSLYLYTLDISNPDKPLIADLYGHDTEYYKDENIIPIEGKTMEDYYNGNVDY